MAQSCRYLVAELGRDLDCTVGYYRRVPPVCQGCMLPSRPGVMMVIADVSPDPDRQGPAKSVGQISGGSVSRLRRFRQSPPELPLLVSRNNGTATSVTSRRCAANIPTAPPPSMRIVLHPGRLCVSNHRKVSATDTYMLNWALTAGREVRVS